MSTDQVLHILETLSDLFKLARRVILVYYVGEAATNFKPYV